MKNLLKEAVRKGLHTVEKPVDGTKRYLKRRLKLYKPVKILAFRGYGNRQWCRTLGRVLEDRKIEKPATDSSKWENFTAMIRRFRTDEIPDCRLSGSMFGQSREATTDSEGYFHIEFETGEAVQRDQLWHDVQLELREKITDQQEVGAVGEVLIPPEAAQFGVISDIDDTIIKSSASDLFQLVKMTMMNNARTRTAVPGAAAFYRALRHGDGRAADANPVFYVSSSAWNLYDLLDEFMDFHDFPRGPILLRDLGIDSMKLLKSGHDHKLEKVREIMNCYPSLPFLLIGDSGQRDAWLYRDVVREFPGRVAAVYIHDVRKSRREDVHAIAGELDAEGVDMLLIENAFAAAEHAAAEGLIREEALDDVAAST